MNSRTSYSGTLADPGPDLAVAVDPSNNDYYVDRVTKPLSEAQHEGESQIVQYDSSGREIGTFASSR